MRVFRTNVIPDTITRVVLEIPVDDSQKQFTENPVIAVLNSNISIDWHTVRYRNQRVAATLPSPGQPLTAFLASEASHSASVKPPPFILRAQLKESRRQTRNQAIRTSNTIHLKL